MTAMIFQEWYCWWLKSGDHQLRWVVYPIIHRVSAPSQVVVNGISAIKSRSLFNRSCWMSNPWRFRPASWMHLKRFFGPLLRKFIWTDHPFSGDMLVSGRVMGASPNWKASLVVYHLTSIGFCSEDHSVVPTLLSATVVFLDNLTAGVARTSPRNGWPLAHAKPNFSWRDMKCLMSARVVEVRVIEFKWRTKSARTFAAQNYCPQNWWWEYQSWSNLWFLWCTEFGHR